MKTYYLLILAVAVSANLYSQGCHCEIKLYFNQSEDSLVEILDYSIKLDSTFVVQKYNRRYEIKLLDCRGELDFKAYDIRTNKIMLQGHFINSLDTLKELVNVEQIDGSIEKKVNKYFEPLKHGLWIFYSSSGNKKRMIEYKNGCEVF